MREFGEAEWGPVEGECLGRFACRAVRGEWGGECVPPPGEACGDHFYAACPPGRVAAERRADAVYRWRMARMSYLGEDHPAWLAEWLAWMQDMDPVADDGAA